MNIERYSFIEGNRSFSYEFISEGPKGLIRKIVQYDRYEQLDGEIYNLGFGDINEDTGHVDDSTISNNNDRDKILGTVAATAIHFMEDHPNAVLFAEGSSPSRTRLYQIGISRFLHEISEVFEVQGFINGNWQPFSKGRNYAAFLIKRK